MILKIPDDVGVSNGILLYVLKNKDIVNTLSELQELGYITKNYELTEKAKKITRQIKVINKSSPEITELALKYRDCFKDSQGRSLKPGATGNLQILKERLKEFKEAYDYSDEHILKAIKLYIKAESVNGFKYLQKSHYTVKKKDGSDYDSRLLTFCEELENESNTDEQIFGIEL